MNALAPVQLAPDPDQIAAFLRDSIGASIHLVAIKPDAVADQPGDVVGRHFNQKVDDAVAWAIDRNNDGMGVYWTVNFANPGVHKKPKGGGRDPDAMGDIGGHRFLHVDIDPPKDGKPFDLKSVENSLSALAYAPSFVIATGGGVGAFWRLDEIVRNKRAVTMANIGLERLLGGDHCHNHDRVMRLPGTVNWPNRKKAMAGRKPTMAAMHWPDDGVEYPLHALSAAFAVAEVDTLPERRAVERATDFALLTSTDLGLTALHPLRSLIDHPQGDDRSRDALACAGRMTRDGFTDEQIAGVLMNPANKVSGHCLDQRDPHYAALRCVEKVRSEAASPNHSPTGASKPGNVPEALAFEWASAVEPQLVGFWLIKKLLPAQGLALLYGHPGSGKTFLALDFGFHVAMGWEWQGRKVNQGLVVYVAAEGARGLRNRIAAFKAHHGIKPTDPFPLAIVPTPIDMQAANADTPRLAETIREACAASGFDPALVIIDTISKTFGGGKENTDDMVTYVANCGRIASEFDCCVMPVHHRPKDAESDDPRGHSSLRGGSDTIIICEAGKPKKARVKKQKDAEEGDTFLFDLVPVELGLDEDGEPVTSCYVRAAMADTNPAIDPRVKSMAKLSDGQRLAFHWLGEAITHHGHAVPSDIPEHVINRFMVSKVTPIDAWRDMFISASRTGGGQVGNDDGGQGADKQADTLSRTFRRYRDKLQALNIIGVWNDYAWIAHGSKEPLGQVPDTLRTSSSPLPDRADTPPYKGGCPVRLGGVEKIDLSRVIFPADDDDGLDDRGDTIGWNG